MANIVSAKQIVALLAKKHSKDLFVPECKDGSTWGEGPTIRLDAWAMRRSWTRWTTWGYEIKASRSDFVQDEKWDQYLELCHHFSFVCPYGLIQPEELPDQVGLLYVSKSGSRVYTKRKAAAREIETPLAVLIYVLMCRAVIASNMWEANAGESAEKKRLYWQGWLQQKEKDRELGFNVSQAIRSKVVSLETRAREAERLAAQTKEARELIKRILGVEVEQLIGFRAERRLAEAVSQVPRDLVYHLREVAKKAESTARQLEALQQGSGDEK